MPRSSQGDPKLQALREQGTANPRPQGVTDPAFQEEAFFDPRDLLQVKYEMLRRVRMEGASVTEASAAFGFSRVAFYQARSRFEERGITGLWPRSRGPKRAHKLSSEVMAFVEESLVEAPSLGARALAARLRDRFGLSVHPRSIERALVRQRKKGRPSPRALRPHLAQRPRRRL